MKVANPSQLFRSARATVVVACLALICWRFYPVPLAAFGQFLVRSDTPEHADAILVLGGDFWGPRVLKGAELGVQGLAPRVLISGPPYQNRPESELAIEFLAGKGYPQTLFLSLPHQARSTIDEAIALAPEMRRLNIHRAILVTRGSHSRRATIVFQLFCPGVHFVSVPATDQFNALSWWSDPESRRLFSSEWSKIFGTILWKYPEFLIGNALKGSAVRVAIRSRFNVIRAGIRRRLSLLIVARPRERDLQG
jgi:uncharacterized SAM-binding protein YcdF (DUF218 family)